ncbi:MAG: response regulator transcription factor [Lachnospiraceae bacterium]|uniref:response regulator transcription factor n=1 Tax=Candidatus Merdisoma sp. JLR.KK011 TaxID=3114299 RepID=UPI0014349C01|nr:response regulator transcription factor [Lachnospiraceae bacterium]MCI9252491.1 response regulator transcription factor [Lachnospiraceae bacterium]MCI9384442.1 response regulator transcription factor [Lachnospiraceae bacterium]MCI9479763.1 response regulator transcription factor [Lachnospiraceae bacterium]MCI9623933.1 response regulator transcription factor [Lachnospiraceae bacterium]
MEKKIILTIDDEPHILELLEYNLAKAGYKVLRAETGEKGLEVLRSAQVDLVLLDCMLPGMDGMEVLREIRADLQLSLLPVMMLTAKGDEIDKVLGLELGADDYLSKPFSLRELEARVKALLRRSALTHRGTQPKEQFQSGGLVVNHEAREVTLQGTPVILSRKEYELLHMLITHPNQVFTREQLLEQIWGYDYFGETRTVDVHIRSLRKKLEKNPEQPEYIRTVRGIGYKFVK